MHDLLLLAIHLLVPLAKFLRPGGARSVAAESLLLKHQLLISNRSRQRAPNLTTLDRFVLGLTTLFVSPHRIPKLFERLIGTIRREYLDRVFFWNAVDLARNLGEFKDYYNEHRVHRLLGGTTPAQRAGASSPAPASLDHLAWR